MAAGLQAGRSVAGRVSPGSRDLSSNHRRQVQPNVGRKTLSVVMASATDGIVRPEKCVRLDGPVCIHLVLSRGLGSPLLRICVEMIFAALASVKVTDILRPPEPSVCFAQRLGTVETTSTDVIGLRTTGSCTPALCRLDPARLWIWFRLPALSNTLPSRSLVAAHRRLTLLCNRLERRSLVNRLRNSHRRSPCQRSEPRPIRRGGPIRVVLAR